MEEEPEVCKNFMRSVTIIFLLGSLVCYAQPPVLVKETFSNNNYGWFEGEAPEYKVAVKDGKYFMDAPEGGWMSTLSPGIDYKKDFFFEATFTQLDGKDDNGVGFIWGSDGKGEMNNFTIAANGYYRIWSSDRSLGYTDEWRVTDLIKPIGTENKLRVEQKKGSTFFYLNGKHLATSKVFPWFGKYLGFVAYTKMRVVIDDFILANDIHISLPIDNESGSVKENLGTGVNTQYDEVSPKISADGKILYFGRKHSPENIGGKEDKEDIWESKTADGKTWSRSINLGHPVNTPITNNLISVSTDNNSLLFHVNNGFAFMHRDANGWTSLEDQGIRFNNESGYLEGCLSSDGKAILFVARLKANAFYKTSDKERDIYVCVKKSDGTWSDPIHTGRILNSSGDEYSPFLSADGRTLYFASNGRPGYGDVDVYMSRRLTDGWTVWSEPVNLGLGINSVGFDAYYTLPASGEYGYMVSNIKTHGLTDIIRFKLPKAIKPDPVVLVVGKALNAKTQQPLKAVIRFDDLTTGKEVGEARSDPRTGDYKIALPSGKNYGYHAAAAGFLSVNENMELTDLHEYSELKKDLLLVPIEIGQSIQLKNVFFVQSKSELKPESYPELDRLVKIMKDNASIEIELTGHTDARGDADANLALSERRVEEVKVYLVSKGVIAKRIVGRGLGGSKPISSSDTEENRQLNRRVEFKITKK
jgi:outer membrane protein OmpA-like peptidoglycan-associated protein